MKGKLKDFFVKYTMVIVLIVVFVFFNAINGGRMLYAQNLSNLLLQNAYVIILACGMLLCILTGGNIDLSVGSVVCLVGAVAAKLMEVTNIHAVAVIAIGLVIAILVGVWQGFWIGYAKIPPFITTLAGMFMIRGLGRVVLDSKTIAIKNDTFLNIFASYIKIPGLDNETRVWSAIVLGAIGCIIYVVSTTYGRINKVKKGYQVDSLQSDIIKKVVIVACIMYYCYKLSQYKGIPVMMIWVLVVVAIYSFVTQKTAFGRHFYAVGGNEKAAKLSGINTNRVYFTAYTQVAMLAGLCGLICAARVGSVNGDSGTQFEMDAIGSCFIGGASAYGGSGTVGGAIIGAILMGIINQGMSIYGLNSNWQYVVKGAVLLIAVIFDIKVNNKNMSKA